MSSHFVNFIARHSAQSGLGGFPNEPMIGNQSLIGPPARILSAEMVTIPMRSAPNMSLSFTKKSTCAAGCASGILKCSSQAGLCEFEMTRVRATVAPARHTVT